MANLRHHSSFWARDDAADAFSDYEDKYGVIGVNSAGRTQAEQQNLINRYDRGGPANRPPFLYPPARPASASNHVRNGGIAIDTSDWRKFAIHAAEFGFSHPYPGGDPVHFEFIGRPGAIAAAGGEFDQNVLNRQKYLNANRAAGLVEDGRNGPRTRAAIKLYQIYLKSRGFYSGAIDGIWGQGTETAHAKNVNGGAAPAVQAGTNPYGLSDVRGLQKIAKKYGYKGPIDNIWGAGSQAGFQEFLRANWGGSITAWLKARYGYIGNSVFGPVARAALVKANNANFNQL